MKLRAVGIALLAMHLASPRCEGSQLKSETAHAFDQYVCGTEKRFRAEVSDQAKFLSVDSWPETDRTKAYAELRQGRIVIRNQLLGKNAPVPGGLIHDWMAIAFLPGARLANTLALLEDYDRDQDYYYPDVVKSKLLSHDGDAFRVFLRLKRTYFITAVFDSEYDVRYTVLNATHAYSQSISTRIAEVNDARGPREEVKPADGDRGLLWRLNSYWRFYQADGGTYVECEAISLTRDIPAGLSWMVGPFLEKIPRESLRFTLTATRNAVLGHNLEEVK